MYIHRIIIRGMKNSPDRDLTFYNDWRDEPLHSVLITGPNGSGKTTLLKVINEIWLGMRAWLEGDSAFSRRRSSSGRSLLRNLRLAAIELRGLPSRSDFGISEATSPTNLENSFWLYVAYSSKEVGDFHGDILQDQQLVNFAGETLHANRDTNSGEIEYSNPDWFKAFGEELERWNLGVGKIPLPNMIFIDAENRQVQRRVPISIDRERRFMNESLYQWAVSHDESNKSEPSLEIRLRNLKVRNPDEFSQMVETVNLFFAGEKHLTDFDRNNLRMRVQIGDDPKNYHYIEDLSSGEKECLLLVFMVSRWLMPGGIVLIDEPDLHLHVSLQRQLIRTLEEIVEDRQGQIIVTSHSPTVWEEYSTRQTFTMRDEEWQKTTGNN